MAQIAISLIVFVVTLGLSYTVRTWLLARVRKTRWHIHVIRIEDELSLGPDEGWACVVRTDIPWETSLPDEMAVLHLPLIGTKWGDDGIVEGVHSER